MKFTGQFIGVTFDRQAYIERLQEYLEEKLKRATDDWLMAVLGQVPVWSGMSHGSLLGVAEEIGTEYSISPREGVESRVFQGEMHGIAQFISQPGIVTMLISTSVPHYVIQEFENVEVSKSAPWKSFAAGEVAYLNAIEDIKLPKLIFKPVKL